MWRNHMSQQFVYHNPPQNINFNPSQPELEEINTLIEHSFSPDNQTQQNVFQKLQSLEMQNVDQLCVNLVVFIGLEQANLQIK